MWSIPENTQKICSILKVLSNKDRLAILCSLWIDEKNVTDLIKCTEISQSQVSQFLSKMKLEWLVDSRKDWKEVYYKINDKQILEVIWALKNIFNNSN